MIFIENVFKFFSFRPGNGQDIPVNQLQLRPAAFHNIFHIYDIAVVGIGKFVIAKPVIQILQPGMGRHFACDPKRRRAGIQVDDTAVLGDGDV